MQIRTKGELKVGPALFVGDMLTGDSWCALGGEKPTKSAGKKQILTLFCQTTQLPQNMQGQFLLISSRDHTVLIKALNSRIATSLQ